MRRGARSVEDSLYFIFCGTWHGAKPGVSAKGTWMKENGTKRGKGRRREGRIKRREKTKK